MSDRAKARVAFTGLSLLLSALVGLILVGAFVLVTRLSAPGALDQLFGRVALTAPVGTAPAPGTDAALTPGSPGGLAPGSSGGGTDPGPGGGGRVDPPTPSPDDPLIDIGVDPNLPVVDDTDLSIGIGDSSGGATTRTVTIAGVDVTVIYAEDPVGEAERELKSRLESLVRGEPDTTVPRVRARLGVGGAKDKVSGTGAPVPGSRHSSPTLPGGTATGSAPSVETPSSGGSQDRRGGGTGGGRSVLPPLLPPELDPFDDLLGSLTRP